MLTHKGTQTLTTARLTLRRFTVGDADAMYQNWANDKRVTRFLTWSAHESPEQTKQLLELWCTEYEKPDYYNWIIEFEHKAIGNISVVQVNNHSESAALGYCIGYHYWGRGIMTEATKAVIDYLFGEIGFHRICLGHAVKNPNSGRVARKCGLTLEGTRRECFKSAEGEFLDISEYGILKQEWETGKAYPKQS
ncbi:MAG: GNAT family N-acetyltransferase [Lachnospiraceae bacterium]|nr:GNAT family N-acetyltransferase [Lachnospiraceae bacterium]